MVAERRHSPRWLCVNNDDDDDCGFVVGTYNVVLNLVLRLVVPRHACQAGSLCSVVDVDCSGVSLSAVVMKHVINAGVLLELCVRV